MGNTNSVLNGHRAKLSKLGKQLLDECVQECVDSKKSEEETVAVVQEKLVYLMEKHGLPPIRLIKFEDMVSLGEFPRFPDNEDLTRDLSSIDRNKALLVFISHCWLRGWSGAEGWDGRPHPDNAAGEKYELCVEGIKRLKRDLAPRMKECYVWLDFGCINQDGNPAGELEQLDKIVQCCDCIFTPIVDHVNTDFIDSEDFYSQYNAKLWNEGPYSYLNRGWCRVEMLYAANIPVQGNDHHTEEGSDEVVVERHSMFEAGLAFHCRESRRPHFLFPSYLVQFLNPPVALAPLQHTFLSEYHPMKGSLSVAADIEHIEQLVSELQPYLDANKVTVGYKGDVNEAGQRHGRGVHQYENGDVYEGDWVEDKQCGEGTLRMSTGAVYSGYFENDVREGRGVCRYVEGNVYEGEWKDGKRHGKGRMSFPDGDFFEGEWVNGLQNGHGTLQYDDGTVFEGEWKNGKKHGQGRYRSADGNAYEGEYKDDNMHGHGTLRYANGAVYEGEWKDDKQHGHGTYRYANGDVYEGEYKDDNMHGRGTYRYANGDVYEGEWKNDWKHGHGTLRYADGSVSEGEWFAGGFV